MYLYCEFTKGAETEVMEKETKHRVLIIDDEKPVGNALGRLLRSEGYRVEIVQSGAEGLERLKEKGYEILICDLQMPEMSGTEVLDEAKRGGYTGKRFLITASEFDDAVDGVTLLRKPWEMREIVKRIDEEGV